MRVGSTGCIDWTKNYYATPGNRTVPCMLPICSSDNHPWTRYRHVVTNVHTVNTNGSATAPRVSTHAHSCTMGHVVSHQGSIPGQFMRFLVDKVVLGQVSRLVIRVSPASINATVPHVHSRSNVSSGIDASLQVRLRTQHTQIK